MIQIGFTQSDKFFSKVIRGVTKEDVSHCVIIVDDLWVVHANHKGVHTQYIGSFLEENRIMDWVDTDIELSKVYDLLRAHEDDTYDMGGMIFSGLALLARRVCPSIVPKRNLWQTTGMEMCTELVTLLTFGKDGVDSMITPGQLCQKLKEYYKQ